MTYAVVCALKTPMPNHFEDWADITQSWFEKLGIKYPETRAKRIRIANSLLVYVFTSSSEAYGISQACKKAPNVKSVKVIYYGGRFAGEPVFDT